MGLYLEGFILGVKIKLRIAWAYIFRGLFSEFYGISF